MIPTFNRWRETTFHFDNDYDAEFRRRRCFVRIGMLAFFAIVVSFGIRGSFSMWNVSGDRCPSRPWMTDPEYLCQNIRPVPSPLFEPFPLFRTLNVDCYLPPPTNMDALRSLCCASVQVKFARLQVSVLEDESGKIEQIRGRDMVSVFSQARDIFCTPDTPCPSLC